MTLAVQYASFEISGVHTYKGRSIHSVWPAVRFEIAVINPEFLDLDARSRALRHLLPLLPTPETVSGEPTGAKRTNATSINVFAELAAAITHALMHRVVEWINPVSPRQLDDPSRFDLVCEYRRSAENAREAGKLALELLGAALRPGFDEEAFKQTLSAFTKNARLSLNGRSAYFLQEAENRGIPFCVPVTRPAILGLGCHQKRLSGTDSTLTNVVAVNIAIDKVKTANLLRQVGIPVPEQRRVRNQEEAISAARRIGYPVVVKPVDGMKGKGVSVRLTSEDAVASAYREAAAVTKSKFVLVESFITGSDYRLLVADGQLVAASLRVPGQVVGNGRDTISDLLAATNSDPKRRVKISVDFDARRMLEEQGFALDSIPDDGHIVLLRSKANLSAGGTSIGVTEQVHPDNRIAAVSAAAALQLDVAGIDFITADISRSYKETGGAICEVNSDPMVMELHVNPTSGSPVAVAPYMLDMLFPPPSTGRVPIIAIYGDEASGTLCHTIANVLQLAGYEVGLASHEGCWIGGDQISAENGANCDGARQVLLHPFTSAAVIEISTESILEDGLGFDTCDVAIVTNSFRRFGDDSDQSRAVLDLIQSSSAALILDEGSPALNAFLSMAGDKPLYCIDRHGGIARIATTSEVSASLKAPEYDELITCLPDGPSREAAFAVVASHAIGLSREAIESSLATGITLSRHRPLLVSGLATRFGRVLMATPRTGEEVGIMCAVARSWAATEDMMICMSFTGNADLQAALTAQISAGSARLVDFSGIFGLGVDDLATVVFGHGNTKAFILTDNMEFFRKRLKSPAAAGRE